MNRKKKRQLTVLDLPFKSILDERPRAGQFILMAWDIKGYCGYESIYWDKDDERCKNCVLWMALPMNHVYTRGCAVVTSKVKNKAIPTLLAWSNHFSYTINNKYVSLDKLRKVAETL